MFSRFRDKKDPEGQPDQEPGGGADPTPTGDLDLGSADVHAQLEQAIRESHEFQQQWKRALADLQNFQRRAVTNEQEARRQGVQAVLYSVLPVLDHFDLALAQTTPDDASKRIMEGVKVIRLELLKALQTHGVVLIAPQLNDDFDPNRHSAIMQQSVQGVEPGRISALFQPGYLMGERVIRSAKVGVAPLAVITPEQTDGSLQNEVDS